MDVMNAILGVFRAVGNWVVESVSLMVPIFYDEGALTFLGTLAVAGLSFSVVFLLIGIVQKFLKFGA